MSKKKSSEKNIEKKQTVQEAKADDKNIDIVDKAKGFADGHKGLVLGCCMAAATAVGAVIGHLVFPKVIGGDLDIDVTSALDIDDDDEDEEDEEDEDD